MALVRVLTWPIGWRHIYSHVDFSSSRLRANNEEPGWVIGLLGTQSEINAIVDQNIV